jgi:X-Pro dipeptidyl-peptidase
MFSKRTLLNTSAAGVLVSIATAIGPAPASAAVPAVPHIAGASTIPVYSYAEAIRESVSVESTTDSDGDGSRDRIAVDIVRPREAAAAGLRVPVIMEASPYYQCCGRGNENERKTYAADGTIAGVPLYYDNYFVPRGYAFVAVDLAGTSRSTGCEDVGGEAEVAGATAAIDWLNGRARGYAPDGTPVRAAWSTGIVGMIGKSWDGTIANAVAATGIRGLATIVPISAISSWYDYMRFNGVKRLRDYPAFLHNFVNGRPVEACAAALERLRSESAEDTGDYNRFWRDRDYRVLSAARVRASVLVAHGINDINVKTRHFAQWWDDLARRDVPRKVWLYQPGHEDPFDVRRAEWVDTLHRWFDRWLYGLRNGVDREPRASLETSPGVWTDERDWPAVGSRPVHVSLGAGDGTTGTLGDRRTPPGTVQSYQDGSVREADLVSSPNTAKAGRLVFLSGALTAPLRVSGSPSVTLRVRVDRPTTTLSARIVDYGTATRIDPFASEGVRNLTTESCWGESTADDNSCYLDTFEVTRTSDLFVLSRGWLDAAHHRTLRTPTPLEPDRWYQVTIPLDATDAVIPAGHTLGLVLGQSDPQFTVPDNQGATVEVDLAASRLNLPAAGRVGLGSPAVAPMVVTTESEHYGPVTIGEVPM